MGEEQNIPGNAKEISPENTQPHVAPISNETDLQTEATISTPQLNTESNTPVMEVHKHPHHLTHKKSWKEYLLEFFMIFLAVFLGFVAENIREHIVEKKRAKQYAKSLISDLKSDTAMINDHIRQITRNMNRIDTLCSYVYDKSLKQVDNFELYYKSQLGSYNPYTWSRTTLDQIRSSGSLRYFDNDSLVKKISDYDAFTRHMDYDYAVDNDQSDRMSIKRGDIVDMNYPHSLVMLLGRTYDSLKNTRMYEEMRSLNKPLLTKEMSHIKALVNEAVQLRPLIRTRRDFELPRLFKAATDLIHVLEMEYHD